MSTESSQEKPSNKSTILKAVLIGFTVGVAFMLTAKFVNFVIM